ncbi:hypothetical protein TNCT_543361 [Trichonephila clavata]|uniref:Uncharacterized protein n=1 Tax=Trichonephila clavata TaxID=2740835 RepID=A0A8X6HG89_TRICU|nr:hypothetical protein TNCT_543361 [Trichonephila clavata]
MCAENSGAMYAENSLVIHTENSIIKEEVSHAGKNEQYFNVNTNKFQMLALTSTFWACEKSSYVLIKSDMWSSLLCNMKCDMCSLDIEWINV